MKSKNLKFILLTIFFCFIFSNYLIAANRIDDDIRDVENFSINDSYLDESLAGFTIKESIFHTETDAEIASNSEQENTQKAFQLEDNPCISLSEKLTVQTTAIFYVFSIKEQDRILIRKVENLHLLPYHVEVEMKSELSLFLKEITRLLCIQNQESMEKVSFSILMHLIPLPILTALYILKLQMAGMM